MDSLSSREQGTWAERTEEEGPGRHPALCSGWGGRLAAHLRGRGVCVSRSHASLGFGDAAAVRSREELCSHQLAGGSGRGSATRAPLRATQRETSPKGRLARPPPAPPPPGASTQDRRPRNSPRTLSLAARGETGLVCPRHPSPCLVTQ